MDETLIGARGQNRAPKKTVLRKKRLTYVVDRRVQLRFVGQIAVLVLVALLLCAANLFVVLSLTPHYPEAAGALSASLTDQSIYWLYGAATLVISLAIFVLVALYVSHRFAGPEVKIVDALQRLANRETEIYVSLRHGDFLGEVATAVNGAATAWQDAAKDVTSGVALLRRRPEVAHNAELKAIVGAIEAAVRPERPPSSSPVG
jgi:hypothetical protein